MKNDILFENEKSTIKYDKEYVKSFLIGHGWDNIHNEAVLFDGIGYIPVVGAIGYTFFDTYEANYGAIRTNLAKLEDNADCKEIVLLISSPGGYANGMFATADLIKKCEKPTHAFICFEGCSAAYGLASACDDITIEPDSITGSIGCIGTAKKIDETFMKEKYGIISKIFKSKVSPHKCESPFDSKEAAEKYQSKIDALGEQFLAMCAENRGVDLETARTSFGEGNTLNCEEALKNGLVDNVMHFVDFAENLTLDTALEEGKGVASMDISTMTSEERSQLFNDLVKTEPSLLEGVLTKEKERVKALNSLRNGSASIDALVDDALEKNLCANDIALDVINAMNTDAKNKEQEKVSKLQELANSTETVDPPHSTVEAERQAFVDKINSIREAK